MHTNQKDPLAISTRTTGFGSPARAYSSRRLDTNELIVNDPYTTYYFRWDDDNIYDIQRGDILVVDRGVYPKPDDLVVCIVKERLTCNIYSQIDPNNLWGVITWKLCPLKK